MLNNLFNKLKDERLSSKKQDGAFELQMKEDDSLIESLSEYLINNFGYDKDKIKIILTNIYKGDFNIKEPKHRQEFIATLRSLIRLETVNKYNTLFIEVTGSERGPLVVLSDLTEIRLNPSTEAAAFITMNERVLVEQFNEEAQNARF